MKKFVIFIFLLITGFFIPVLINYSTYYLLPSLALPYIVQHLLFPLLHALFLEFAYFKITRQPLVSSYKILTGVLFYLALVLLYFVIVLFTPFINFTALPLIR